MDKMEEDSLKLSDGNTDHRDSEHSPVDTIGKTVYRVKVAHSNETILSMCDQELKVNCGDYVIIPTKYGKDLGRVRGKMAHLNQLGGEEVYAIHRLANANDLTKYENNKKSSIKAFEICKQKISAHNLEMKLVSAHYLLEEPKILFFFTAENRVDFRELVKDLVAVLKIRIELRQIGVRDESRVLGGIGICGRYLCCHAITDKLNPVSIKMAKEQNMSLNSLKISGPCGRLLCCLGYEHDFYQSEKENLPLMGSKFSIHDEDFIITEINILTKQIRLFSNSGRLLTLCFADFSYDAQSNQWRIDQSKVDALS